MTALCVVAGFAAAPAAALARLEARNIDLPLLFEPNVGQAPDDVAFVARAPRYLLTLTADGMIAAYGHGTEAASAIRVRFNGAQRAAMVGVDQQTSRTNYLIGNDPQRWRTDVTNFKRVAYSQVYPGIDLVFYGNERRVEYDFVVAPGADPTQISLDFDHPNRDAALTLRIDDVGDLVLGNEPHTLSFKAPVAYQDIDGRRRPVPSRYVARGSNVAFAVGAYDASKPLVIDPVLVYSGYLGGTLLDNASSIAVDAAGNAYITGFTRSTNFDTEKALQPQNPNTGTTTFVTKFNAAGDGLVYSTYLGGSAIVAACGVITDAGVAIRVDSLGNAYIAGDTCSPNFPGAQNSISGARDAFVAKLNAAGDAIAYARYLGGGNLDSAKSLAVDAEGNAYVGGLTVGPGIFPTTAGAWMRVRDPEDPSSTDNAGFIAKINSSGGIVWSSYVRPADLVSGIALDQQNPPNVFITGPTCSSEFPTTPGAFSREVQGCDAFVVKLDPTASAPIAATLFGGSLGGEVDLNIAVGPQGNAYIFGTTYSQDLPLSITPFDGSHDDAWSAFFTVFNDNMSNLIYSTYLGGENGEFARGIVVRDDGVAYVAGVTASSGFPVRDAIQGADGVGCTGGVCFGNAAFVSWINPGNLGHQDLLFSTYLGGNSDDQANGIALDAAGNAYVAGVTLSTDFPEAGFPVQDHLEGTLGDVFITKIGSIPVDPTDTPTRTQTPSRTPTPSSTVSRTPTPSETRTPTASGTPSASTTITRTQTRTPTSTLIATPTSTATPTSATCGNGRLDPGEECDEGSLNSDTEPNRCRTTCLRPRCGDNVLDDLPPFSESCDDGNQTDHDGCPSTCTLQIALEPFLILGKGLCDNAPVPVKVTDLGTGNDISGDPDIEYQWIRGSIAPRILDAALKRFVAAVTEKVEGEEPPMVKTATLNVVKGNGTAEVQFAPGQEGLGVNVLRAVRKRNGVEVAASNISLVISGMKLAEETGLDIEPVSPLNSAVSFMTEALRRELEDPPLILFKHGPLCNGEADFLGAEGTVRVKSIKFDFFGGIIEDVNLITAIQSVIGAIPFGGGPLGFIARAVELGVPYIVSQFLDFEVSSKAAADAEEESGRTQTEDNVISVSDAFSVNFPFFRGIVTAKEPGISAVQATLDLESLCLGKADDSVLVLVGPRLDKVEIRNEPGLFESPITVPLNGDRLPHAVGTFTMVPSGSPQVLEFDPVHLTGDRVTKFRKKIERFIPGLEQILDDFNIPIEIVVPRGAMREGDRNTYRGGNAYFQIAFQYNPFPGTITISELRFQTSLPNWPILTTWTSTSPPDPVVRIAETAATTTGIRRGLGQIRVEVCLPFLTGPGSDPVDFEEVRVSGDDVIIIGNKFEDLNANGRLDSGEPGLRDWTISAVDLYDRTLATTTTGGSGEFILIVPRERFPPDTTLYGVREVLKPGWSATNPRNGFRAGLRIADSAAFITFGNFRDIQLSGVKFHDRDGNGLRSADEEGLFGWKIELIDSFGTVQRVTTDPDGLYEFSIPYDAFTGPGPVSVREVIQSGWTNTFPRDGAAQPIGDIGTLLRSGQKVTVNFGNFRDLRIQGRKFDDRNGNGMRDDGELGLEGWTIQFVDTFGHVRSTVTDVDGDYFFRLPLTIFRGSGQAQVREVQQPGWVQTFPFGGGPRDFPDAEAGMGLISDGRYEVNFGNRRVATATPTGTPDDEATATPTPDEETATPTETPTATRPPANILTGVKYEDVNGNGERDVEEPRLRNWVIFLDDNLDDVLNNSASGNGVCDANAEEECKLTDVAGVYAFPVGPGLYRVREVQQPGWAQTSRNPPDVFVEDESGPIPLIERPNTLIIPRGESFQFLDFGNFRLGSVPGVKFEDANGNARQDSSERGLPGWTIFADDNDNGMLDDGEASVDTDANGTYRFTGLAPGRHVLREVNRCGYQQTLPLGRAGYEIDPSRTEDIGPKDFGNRPPAAIPGDSNRDGMVSAADVTAGARGLTGARQNELMDANGDGNIDDTDLDATAANMFACSGLFAAVPPLATHTPQVSNTPTLVPTPTAPASTPTSLPATRTATAPAPTQTPTGVVTSTATNAPGTATRTPTGTPTRGTPTPTGTLPAVCRNPANPIAIPDGNGSGIDDVLNVTDTPQITDLNVRLLLLHSWVGDLTITLTHVTTGTSVVLLDRVGDPAVEQGCGSPDINAVLTDEAGAAAEDACADGPALAGNLRPTGALSAFDGETLTGQWRLHIVDGVEQDSGALIRWCLEANAAETVEPTPTPSPTSAVPFGCDDDDTAIPDANAAGANADLTINADVDITDVDVKIVIAHPYVGDIVVRLTHVDTGTSVTLIDRPGIPTTEFGCAFPTINTVLDDDALSSVEDACDTGPAIEGRLIPNAPLSGFDGESSAGTWRLTVADFATGDVGMLTSWCIGMNGAALE